MRTSWSLLPCDQGSAPRGAERRPWAVLRSRIPRGGRCARGHGCRPAILMVPCGRYRKNADLVLRTWPLLREKHPELVLVVTSYCDPRYVEKVHALGPSIRLTGFVDDELMCSLYHGAAAIWFPSIYEGFRPSSLEAMACGTPVVATNSSLASRNCRRRGIACFADVLNTGSYRGAGRIASYPCARRRTGRGRAPACADVHLAGSRGKTALGVALPPLKRFPPMRCMNFGTNALDHEFRSGMHFSQTMKLAYILTIKCRTDVDLKFTIGELR